MAGNSAELDDLLSEVLGGPVPPTRQLTRKPIADKTEPAKEPERVSLVPPLEAGVAKVKIKRVSYTHDAMIDIILANPSISQEDLAETFGYTAAWISTIKNSDAFQARLAVRRDLLVGSSHLQNINERMRQMAHKSLDTLEMVLDASIEEKKPNAAIALEIFKVAAKGFGFGGGGGQTNNLTINNQTTQQNVVVVPAKALTANEWAKEYGAQEGLAAETAVKQAVPPMTPGLAMLCTDEAMDVTPELVPVGQRRVEE